MLRRFKGLLACILIATFILADVPAVSRAADEDVTPVDVTSYKISYSSGDFIIVDPESVNQRVIGGENGGTLTLSGGQTVRLGHYNMDGKGALAYFSEYIDGGAYYNIDLIPDNTMTKGTSEIKNETGNTLNSGYYITDPFTLPQTYENQGNNTVSLSLDFVDLSKDWAEVTDEKTVQYGDYTTYFVGKEDAEAEAVRIVWQKRVPTGQAVNSWKINGVSDESYKDHGGQFSYSYQWGDTTSVTIEGPEIVKEFKFTDVANWNSSYSGTILTPGESYVVRMGNGDTITWVLSHLDSEKEDITDTSAQDFRFTVPDKTTEDFYLKMVDLKEIAPNRYQVNTSVLAPISFENGIECSLVDDMNQISGETNWYYEKDDKLFFPTGRKIKISPPKKTYPYGVGYSRLKVKRLSDKEEIELDEYNIFCMYKGAVDVSVATKAKIELGEYVTVTDPILTDDRMIEAGTTVKLNYSGGENNQQCEWLLYSITGEGQYTPLTEEQKKEIKFSTSQNSSSESQDAPNQTSFIMPEYPIFVQAYPGIKSKLNIVGGKLLSVQYGKTNLEIDSAADNVLIPAGSTVRVETDADVVKANAETLDDVGLYAFGIRNGETNPDDKLVSISVDEKKEDKASKDKIIFQFTMPSEEMMAYIGKPANYYQPYEQPFEKYVLLRPTTDMVLDFLDENDTVVKQVERKLPDGANLMNVLLTVPDISFGNWVYSNDYKEENGAVGKRHYTFKKARKIYRNESEDADYNVKLFLKGTDGLTSIGGEKTVYYAPMSETLAVQIRDNTENMLPCFLDGNGNRIKVDYETSASNPDTYFYPMSLFNGVTSDLTITKQRTYQVCMDEGDSGCYLAAPQGGERSYKEYYLPETKVEILPEIALNPDENGSRKYVWTVYSGDGIEKWEEDSSIQIEAEDGKYYINSMPEKNIKIYCEVISAKALQVLGADQELDSMYFEGTDIELTTADRPRQRFLNWVAVNKETDEDVTKELLQDANAATIIFKMPSYAVQILAVYEEEHEEANFVIGAACLGKGVKLGRGIPYKLDTGKSWKVSGDTTSYAGGVTFYVSEDADYLFES